MTVCKEELLSAACEHKCPLSMHTRPFSVLVLGRAEDPHVPNWGGKDLMNGIVEGVRLDCAAPPPRNHHPLHGRAG